MQILTNKIKKDDLLNLQKIGEKETFFDYMIKLVVDIENEQIAINAELHSDLEEFLLHNGSLNKNLYGVNINFENFEIEFDSLINPPRNRDDGYPRAGRIIQSPEKRKQIERIINKWIEI